jgi:DNA polymerase I-like protein with 3'-5' exonuclease and polymerase domains
MHRDTAMDIFILKEDEVEKAIRNSAKGDQVFPQFYGSYYAQTAPDLWDFACSYTMKTGITLKEHLANHGIKTYAKFEKHVEKAEKIMWGERFKEHDTWRKSMTKDYQKKGYVELHTGFRCYGPMSRNNTFNTSVQGAAYHVNQWSMNKLTEKLDKSCEKSYIIGQIHDCIVMNIWPAEEALIDHWVYSFGTQRVRKHWPWIIAPLVIEKEFGAVDAAWSEASQEITLKEE